MTIPQNISIHDYTYSLPEERIAHYPLGERDSSKLLIYKERKIKTGNFRNIVKYIPEDSFLIFNDTKVVEARLLFQKTTGGMIEIFCLEPHEQYADITTAMLQKEKVLWQCLVGGASKWKPGQVLEKKIRSAHEEIMLQAKYIGKRNDSFLIELSWSKKELSFAEVLHHAGAIPLPPYIKRPVERSDSERYQTIYAQAEGSVAAPTAGLHFTERILKELDKIYVVSDFVTLHVGAGTFKPVKSQIMLKHEMHSEWIDVSKEFIENLLNNLEEAIVAVGTTSLRTVESLYWLGVKQLVESGEWRVGDRNSIVNSRDPIAIGSRELSQWEAYELAEKNIPVPEALQTLLNWMNKNNLERLITKTQILIAPGYEFKIVKGLITNFHQPQSTLLLLVAAFIGEDWRVVYDYALQNDFRFLSYGDGSLLWKENRF